MDELDLLKQHWNNATTKTSEKTLSQKDIYGMLHKNSSSILKTLFYISIFELILFTGLSIIPLFSNSFHSRLENIYANSLIIDSITAVSIIVIFCFVYLLYKNHKHISTTATAKHLIESILKTIKIVNYYVLYNLILAAVIMSTMFYQVLHKDPELIEKLNALDANKQLLLNVLIIGSIIGFVLLIWGFYKLLYGRLLKRLKINHKELLKLNN